MVVDQVYQVLRREAESLPERHNEDLSVPNDQAPQGSNRGFGSLSDGISNQSRLIRRVVCAPRSGPDSILNLNRVLSRNQLAARKARD